MGDTKAITKGIKSCYYAYNGELKYSIAAGTELFIQAKQRHKFYIDPANPGLFGEETVNPAATAADAKWAFIFNAFFKKAMETPEGETYPLWGDVGKPHDGMAISQLGIGRQYKYGPSIEFVPENEEDVWLGRIYRVEVFNRIPNEGFYFYFVPVSSARIQFAYFDFQEIREPTNKLDLNDGYYSYGQTHTLHLYTHLLPISNIPTNFEPEKLGIHMERDTQHLQLQVFITDADYNNLKEEPIIEDDLMKFYKSTTGANGHFEIPIELDPEWKGTLHQSDEKIKAYYFTLKIKNTETGDSYPSTGTFQVDTTGLKRVNDDYTDYESFEVSSCLQVKYETQEEIRYKLEREKSNQIQYIGDIEFTQKEFDPCGYSTITIKDESDDKRTALTIFDENEKVIDKTDKVFEITAGEQRKTVSVKVGNLTTQQVYCQGLLLKDGEKHAAIQNVFQIVNAAFSARKGPDDYETVPDDTHKQQLRAAGTRVTRENKNDTDVVRVEQQDIQPVVEVLGWQEDTDYAFVGTDALNIFLKYYYIKTLTLKNREFEPNVIGDLFEDAWLFNYLVLQKERQLQQYYIPVSSCRYPNQIARINVLPDIKWVLLFKLNFEEKDFQSFKEEHNYELKGFLANSTTEHYGGTDRVSRTSRTVAGVSLSRTTTIVPKQRMGGLKRMWEIIKRIEATLIATWKDENGQKQEKDLIDGFAKQVFGVISKFIAIAKMAGSLAEGDSNEEDKSKKNQLDKEMKKLAGGRSLDGVWDVLTKKSVEAEAVYPSIAFSASWYYKNAVDPARPEDNGQQGLQMDFKIKADPIIGLQIKWDFLEMLARRHPLAFIIKKGVDLLLYLSDPGNKAEVSFTLKGTVGVEGNLNHNLVSGGAYTNGKSVKKEELLSGGLTILAELKGNIVMYNSSYLIISEYKVGAEVKLGVKAEFGSKSYLGADPDGIYMSNQAFFDGLTFYIEAEAKAEVTFLGAKIVDWNPKFEPEPLTWGKCSLDKIKFYPFNPDKRIEVMDFDTDD